jgi:hypothetical protein
LTLLRDPTQVMNVSNIIKGEHTKAEEDAYKVMKAPMLISRADKRRYGRLKDKPTNKYLLETNQYPDTFEKALCIL